MQAETLSKSSFSSRRLIDALSVLSTCQKSSLIPLIDPGSFTQGPQPGTIRAASHDYGDVKSLIVLLFSPYIFILLPQHYQKRKTPLTLHLNSIPGSVFLPWSFSDRIVVIAGLCEVLKASPAASDLFLKVIKILYLDTPPSSSCPFTCPSLCMFVNFSISLSLCLPVYLSLCLSVCLSVMCLFQHL
jgi:hypothetical protein